MERGKNVKKASPKISYLGAL
jgi:hypothetical protein